MSERYRVVFMHHASSSVTVEADSPEEAAGKAEVEAGLCWQCSSQLETDLDVDGLVVLDEDGEELLEELSDCGARLAKAEAAIARLRAQLEAAGLEVSDE